MKTYRFILRFVQVAIILVVLPRVGNFVANLGVNEVGFDIHDLTAVAFAITLGLGTIASAYFADETPAPEYDDEVSPRSKEYKRRENEAAYYATMNKAAPYAKRAVLAFAFLDGAFNLGDAVTVAVQAGKFTLTAATSAAIASGVMNISHYLEVGSIVIFSLMTVAFGVSPTVLSIILARAISMVDRIPTDYERPKDEGIDWVRTILGNLNIREFRYSEPQTATKPKNRLSPTKQLIWDYMDAGFEQLGRAPSYSELMEALPDPKPSNSTVSVTRREWLEQ